MKVAGIDYSLTSPAMFICEDTDTSFQNGHVFYLTQKKTFTGDMGNIHGTLMPQWESPQERYDRISEHFSVKIHEFNIRFVTIEGYAMGSKTGLVFNIAEAGGTLKYKLYKESIPFGVVAPTQVKKFATGKGNSKKDAMYESFLSDTGVDLEHILSSKRHLNPISDIVDAYYVNLLGIQTLI